MILIVVRVFCCPLWTWLIAAIPPAESMNMSKSKHKSTKRSERPEQFEPSGAGSRKPQPASNPPKPPKPGDHGPQGAPSRHVRTVLSLILVLHLLAVLAPPLNFATRGSGPQLWLYQWLRTYSQLAYLDHGYFFFAPNPGASHLVRYRVEFDDGREPVEDMFPDKTKQSPRLLYHRHFMLAEHLHARYAPPEAPADLPPGEEPAWRDARALYEARWSGFEQHLLAAHQADRIQMFRVEHRPPHPLEFLDGVPLDAPALYADLPELPQPGERRAEPSGAAFGPLGPAPMRPPNDRPLGPIGPLAPTSPLNPFATPPVRRARPLESLESIESIESVESVGPAAPDGRTNQPISEEEAAK